MRIDNFPIDRYVKFIIRQEELFDEVMLVFYYRAGCLQHEYSEAQIINFKKVISEFITDEVVQQFNINLSLIKGTLHSWSIHKGKTFVFRNRYDSEIEMMILRDYVHSPLRISRMLLSGEFQQQISLCESKSRRIFSE